MLSATSTEQQEHGIRRLALPRGKPTAVGPNSFSIGRLSSCLSDDDTEGNQDNIVHLADRHVLCRTSDCSECVLVHVPGLIKLPQQTQLARAEAESHHLISSRVHAKDQTGKRKSVFRSVFVQPVGGLYFIDQFVASSFVAAIASDGTVMISDAKGATNRVLVPQDKFTTLGFLFFHSFNRSNQLIADSNGRCLCSASYFVDKGAVLVAVATSSGFIGAYELSVAQAREELLDVRVQEVLQQESASEAPPVAMSMDDSFICAAHGDGKIVLYSLPSAEPDDDLGSWRTLFQCGAMLPSYVALHPSEEDANERIIAVGTVGGSVLVLDTSSTHACIIGAHLRSVCALSLKDNGSVLLTAGEDGFARVWRRKQHDAANVTLLWEYHWKEAALSGAAWLNEDHVIVVMSSDTLNCAKWSTENSFKMMF